MTVGGYTLKASFVAGRWMLFDLRGSGKAGDLIKLLREARNAVPRPFYATVEYCNPNYARLVAIYENMGMKKASILMECN